MASPLALAKCGGTAGVQVDAQVRRNNSLAILTPPGDAIGLDFSGLMTLRVELRDPNGDLIRGQPIHFDLLESGSESSGGASLSATTDSTDAQGIAQVDVVAGAQRVTFRVEASTENAPSVLFYVQVSDQGFSDLSVETAHQGPRDVGRYQQIKLRIYDDRNAHCRDIDFANPPQTLMPPRRQGSFGETSSFSNLAVDLGYTIIAWAEAGVPATPQASACLHLASDRLRSGARISLVLPLVDTNLNLTTSLPLETRVDLQPLRNVLPHSNLWATLSCPLGRAQLLLDCLDDAQGGDGALDCVPSGQSALGDALQLRRGSENPDGCRPATIAGGAPSIDAMLTSAIQGWPTSAERASLIEGRALSLGTLLVRSELASAGESLASHRITGADISGHSANLAVPERPVLTATAVPMTLTASPILELAEHAFTLRVGLLVQDVFYSVALLPANATGQGKTLGTKLVESSAIGSLRGCPALEDFVCSSLGLATACADRCADIALPLDQFLGAWLRAFDVVGADYSFALQARVADSALNLNVDSLVAEGSEVQLILRTTDQDVALPAVVRSVP